MSWNISIFFNAPEGLGSIVRTLENLWLVTFQRQEDQQTVFYRYEGLGLLIDVFNEHGLVDDMGIVFTHYAYQICIEVIGKVEPYRSFGRSTAIFFAHQIYKEFGWECIVVENLQRQILALP